MKRAVSLTLALTAAMLAFAAAGSAQGGRRHIELASSQKPDDKFKARPGVYDPDKTGAVDAQWVSGQGERDDRGNGNFALYMQKAAPTATNAAAGALIDGVQGKPADGIYGFDIRSDGHCGAGGPRYDLIASDGFHFIGGCANGTKTPVPGNPSWTRVTFDAKNPAQAFPVVTPGATIVYLSILTDEGTDAGPDFSGYSYVDNLNVVGQSITKPGAAQ